MRLGLAPPKTPLAPTPDNEAGFHESIPMTALNELILKASGCNWHDCLSFDPDMLDDEVRVATFERCTAILREEFADHPAFVVKDPQLCLTLPIWRPALQAVGAAVSVLLVVRHPEEVASSVFWRDMLPMSETALVWLHHTLEAERMTRDLPRAVVFYDDLVNDWRGCMARAGRIANIAWPAQAGLSQRDTGDVVIPSLRHHNVASNPFVTILKPPVSDLINDAWLALGQLGNDPALPSVQRRLDDVRERFALHREASTKRGT